MTAAVRNGAQIRAHNRRETENYQAPVIAATSRGKPRGDWESDLSLRLLSFKTDPAAHSRTVAEGAAHASHMQREQPARIGKPLAESSQGSGGQAKEQANIRPKLRLFGAARD
jgi:hypothetical protein